MTVIPQQSLRIRRNFYKRRLPNLQIIFKCYEILMTLNYQVMKSIYYVMGNELNKHALISNAGLLFSIFETIHFFHVLSIF